MAEKHVLFLNATYVMKERTLATAKERGLRVSVVGPRLPGWAQPYVDRFVPADTYDAGATISALRPVHAREPFDGVLTFWDRDVEIVACVAQELGLPGSSPEAARNARNKYRMREALCRHGVAHPRYASASSWDELVAAAAMIGYPLIYKPVAASSSKGVQRIDDPDGLRPAYELMRRYATPAADAMFSFYAGQHLVEEFMAGPEVSVEGIVFDGAVTIVGITEKLATAAGFIEYQHAFPARLPSEEAATVAAVTTAAISAVGLDNCGFHVEVMLTRSGPKIVEVNGRLGGDLITTHLVPLATGVDIVGAALQVALGERPDLEPRCSRAACARFLLAARAGVVAGWEGTDSVHRSPGVEAFGIERRPGEQVGLPPQHVGCARLGYVVTEAQDAGSAIRRADIALKTVKCRIA